MLINVAFGLFYLVLFLLFYFIVFLFISEFFFVRFILIVPTALEVHIHFSWPNYHKKGQEIGLFILLFI